MTCVSTFILLSCAPLGKEPHRTHLTCVFQGACILNMLQDFLTPDAFEIGIIRYLKRYSYRNTVSRDLWESLTDVSGFIWSYPGPV